MPSHYQARITFYFIKIDAWNNNKVTFNVDGTDLTQSLTFTSTMDSSKLCGNTNGDAIRQYDASFIHSSSSLTFSVRTDLSNPASVSSWGIHDLTLILTTCHPNCRTCQSTPNKEDCLSCNYGFSFRKPPPPGECEGSCPVGLYQNLLSGNCESCDPSCKVCFGPSSTECGACFDGKVIFNFKSNSSCVERCPNSYIAINGICQLCDSTCTQCSGINATECTKCTFPLYLMSGMCVIRCLGTYFGDNSTATCVSECPEHTFPYIPTKVCSNCMKCKTCVGFNPNDCTSCDPPLVLEEGKCLNNCSQDHFFNNETGTCDSNKILNLYN